MPSFLLSYWRSFGHAVNRMELNDWIVVFVMLVLFGAMCLRGLGARSGSNY